MDRFQYSKEQKLKQDKLKFLQKCELRSAKTFYDNQIQQLNEKYKEFLNKRNHLLNKSLKNEKILTQYISELNKKFCPNSISKFYDKEKVKINLSNMSILNFLQNYKKSQFIKDKNELGDDAIKKFQLEDIKFSEKILTLKNNDQKICGILDDNKLDMNFVHKNYRQIMSYCDKNENSNLTLNFRLETAKKINKSLTELYKKEHQIYKKNSKLNEVKDIINSRNEILEKIENISLIKSNISNKFNTLTNSKKKVMKWFKENKSNTKNPYIIINDSNNNNKHNITKNKSVCILAYSSKSLKNYSKNNEIINNNRRFQNNQNLLLKSTENNTTTKINTISTSNCNSIIKTFSASDKCLNTLIKNDTSKNNIKYEYDKTFLNESAKFLSDKIITQKKKITNIKNKISEQKRIKYQIKNLIINCIEDVKFNINDDRIMKVTNNIIRNKLDKEIEKNYNILKLLDYIYYNCLDTIIGCKSIFHEFRKNKSNSKNKIHSFKKCLSFTNQNFFKGKI